MRHEPRTVGLACAIGATALGLVYLFAGGAPTEYALVNIAALVMGIGLWYGIGRIGPISDRAASTAMLIAASILLGTAFLGISIDGATRWLRIGPIAIQPAAIAVPAMLVAYAGRQNALATLAMMVAAVALVFQPDRALAGVLAAALMARAFRQANRRTVTALAIALIAFVATLLKPDRVAPAPFVERVFPHAFDVHPLVGLAVAAGAALLLVPAVAGLRSDPIVRTAHLVFGAAWLAFVLAAFLGDYPAPLVGYGSSAILGYLLSLALLPRERPNQPSAVR